MKLIGIVPLGQARSVLRRRSDSRAEREKLFPHGIGISSRDQHAGHEQPCQTTVKSRTFNRATTVLSCMLFEQFGLTLNEEQIPQIVDNNKNQGGR
jgi:hypothetical protein